MQVQAIASKRKTQRKKKKKKLISFFKNRSDIFNPQKNPAVDCFFVARAQAVKKSSNEKLRG